MKSILLSFFFLLFSTSLTAGLLQEYKDSPEDIKLCFNLCNSTWDNEGYFYAKSLLVKYKDDIKTTSIIKLSLMCCHVTEDNYKDLADIADEVIVFSDKPYPNALAWFHKANYAFIKDCNKAIAYSGIAIRFFEKTYKESERDKGFYQHYYCHWMRKTAFEYLDENENAKKEKTAMETDRFKWLYSKMNGWPHDKEY